MSPEAERLREKIAPELALGDWDPDHKYHAVRVRDLALVIVTELGITDQQVKSLFRTASEYTESDGDEPSMYVAHVVALALATLLEVAAP